jgi:cellulose synthase/poly-beta-1,6-N-acetylglucosamine synthase-like glycosyltransferase
MAGLYLLGLCGLTTAVALWLGQRRGLRASSLSAAFFRVLECVGLAVLLFAANVVSGMAIVLALRALTGRFLSLYANTDITLIVLSFLQAILLQAWFAGAGDREKVE